MSHLKLLALDTEDLQVISTCCQDGVLKVGDMDYLANSHNFLMSFNRFDWENSSQAVRRRSVLRVARVERVELMGIDPSEKDMTLSLLAILFEPGETPAGTLELVFAGDGAVRLHVECVEVQLADLAAAWEAKQRPGHAV